MCGIAGIFAYSGRKIDADELVRMRDTMIHRGPDGGGLWIGDDATIG